MGCYIWYSEDGTEGTGRGLSPPSPLLAVPNVASTACVPIRQVKVSHGMPSGLAVHVCHLQWVEMHSIAAVAVLEFSFGGGGTGVATLSSVGGTQLILSC